MLQAVPKEGRFAPLFLLAITLLVSTNGVAQTIAPEDLQRCAALETDELKLACFESLASTEAESVDTVELPEREPEPAAIAVAPAAIVVSEEVAADAAISKPAPAADNVQVPESVPGPDIRQDPAPTVAPDDLGDEYLKQAEEPKTEPEIYFATVDKVTREYDRRLTFYFDNGQVWRQVASDYLQYPKGETFDVEISRGMMGDYQIRVRGEGRMTRISRIK